MENIKFAIEYLKNNSYKMVEENNNYAVQTSNMAIEALEKQIPQKGIPCNSAKCHNFVECGVCNKDMGMYYQYCPHCGQKIDWRND